jgi:hypothetical protein
MTGEWESGSDDAGGFRHKCCCGKAVYATEREAGKAARRMRRQGRDRAWQGLLRPYMCPERRGKWHVGHEGDFE